MREELHFLPSSSYLLLCPRKCATLCCWRRLKGWPGQIKDEELAYRDRILAAAKLMRCKFKAEKGFDIFFSGRRSSCSGRIRLCQCLCCEDETSDETSDRRQNLQRHVPLSGAGRGLTVALLRQK